MLPDLLGVVLPTLDDVTILTFRSELAAMDVRMAIRAARANAGKDEIRVAELAGHFFVHAAQRVVSPVVVKLRNAANGFPACIGVTVLTRDIQRSVRISAALLVVPVLSGHPPKGRNDQD